MKYAEIRDELYRALEPLNVPSNIPSLEALGMYVNAHSTALQQLLDKLAEAEGDASNGTEAQ